MISTNRLKVLVSMGWGKSPPRFSPQSGLTLPPLRAQTPPATPAFFLLEEPKNKKKLLGIRERKQGEFLQREPISFFKISLNSRVLDTYQNML